MKIEDIRHAIEDNVPVEISIHANLRMDERDISLSDIRNCIFTGEIIEDYPVDKNNDSPDSYPSCLICGQMLNNSPLHVVCGLKERLLIITVYIPDPEKMDV